MMARFGIEARQALVVRHPLLTGFAWSALTLLLLALIESALAGRAVDALWLSIHLPIFAAAAPLWGYATRWAILKRQHNAR